MNELKTCCPECTHHDGNLRCAGCHGSGSRCRNFGGEKCCEVPKEPPHPITAEGWLQWALFKAGNPYDLNNRFIEAIRLAMEQAFNQGVNSERHKTKVVPEWMKKPYYDLGRKAAILECAKEIERLSACDCSDAVRALL